MIKNYENKTGKTIITGLYINAISDDSSTKSTENTIWIKPHQHHH